MRFLTFQGRARRLEYLLHTVGGVVFFVSYSVFLDYVQNHPEPSGWIGPLGALIFLLLFVLVFALELCVTVRRLHDLGRPGSHYWRLFIPFYNIYLGLLLHFTEGTAGLNQFDRPLSNISIPMQGTPGSALPLPGGRPTAVTFVCAIAILLTIMSIVGPVTDIVQRTGSGNPYYPLAIGIVALSCLVGLWTMRRWGLYGYIGASAIALLMAYGKGQLTLFNLLIPAVVIAVALTYQSRMK